MSSFLPYLNLIFLVVACIIIALIWRAWKRSTGHIWPEKDNANEKLSFARRVKLPAFYILAIAILLILFIHHQMTPSIQ